MNTEPSPALNNRVLKPAVGNGLGGGSLINSCVYTRGSYDFDQWESMGRKRWGYDTLEPYFAKSEKAISRDAGLRGSDGSWGAKPMSCPRELKFMIVRSLDKPEIPRPSVQELAKTGLLIVIFVSSSLTNNHTASVLTAAPNLGFVPVHDVSSPDTHAAGCALLDLTIDENRRRVSTRTAFLPAELVIDKFGVFALLTVL